MAQLEPTAYKPHVDVPETDYFNHFQALSEVLQREEDEALKRWDETGDITGLFYRVQIADGYATYRVTKIDPFTIQYVDTGVGYTIPDAHVRGLIKNDVVQYAAWVEALHGVVGRR